MEKIVKFDGVPNPIIERLVNEAALFASKTGVRVEVVITFMVRLNDILGDYYLELGKK